MKFEKTKRGRVNYKRLRRKMDFVFYSKQKTDSLSKFARNLSLFLKSRELSINNLLKEISANQV